MAENTITYFSHPGHELVKRHYVGPYICDMCWEGLSGPAYGCRAGCDFAIHDACAGHAPTLDSPPHHPHQLVLVETRRDVAHVCDVCAAGRCAPGCFLYRCPPCGFDMHPRCARLPLAVRSARHPAHDLALAAGEGRCAACRRGGRAWYYRCTVCSDLELHVSCAAAGAGEEEGAGGARRGGNGHGPGAQNGVPRDDYGEVLRARREVESAMAFAAGSLPTSTSDFPLYFRTRRQEVSARQLHDKNKVCLFQV